MVAVWLERAYFIEGAGVNEPKNPAEARTVLVPG
jgi:hypothetical protein